MTEQIDTTATTMDANVAHMYESKNLKLTITSSGTCDLTLKNELETDEEFNKEIGGIDPIPEILSLGRKGTSFIIVASSQRELVSALTDVIQLVEALAARQKA